MKRVVAWLSGGVSSFIAAWLSPEKITDLVFIDIHGVVDGVEVGQTRDTLRFAKEAALFLRDNGKMQQRKIKPLEILESPYQDPVTVFRMRRLINTPKGAPCTEVLKRRVRKEWEYAHKDDDITYIWGYDNKEQHRIDNIEENNPQFKHLFPLRDNNISKQNAHAICKELGLKRADMYEYGFPNANCIACVKGGIGYWNLTRKVFPDVFNLYANLELEIDATCLHDKSGKIWLKTLPPDRGVVIPIECESCGIACGLQREQEEQHGTNDAVENMPRLEGVK